MLILLGSKLTTFSPLEVNMYMYVISYLEVDRLLIGCIGQVSAPGAGQVEGFLCCPADPRWAGVLSITGGRLGPQDPQVRTQV